MTLNYRVIVERYPFPNGMVGSSIPALKYSLYINTIFVNRRLLKVSKLNMPIVWDANIVGIQNIGNIKNMMIYKFAYKEYSLF